MNRSIISGPNPKLDHDAWHKRLISQQIRKYPLSLWVKRRFPGTTANPLSCTRHPRSNHGIRSSSLLVLLLLFSLTAAAAGSSQSGNTRQQEVAWQRWTPEVFTRAQQEQRLILVDLAAEWCTFCKKMDKTTWRDDKVLGSIDKYYIPVRVQDEIDPELAEKYRGYGRPAFVVLNGEGVEVARKRGYLQPQMMHWMLEGIAENPTPEANQ
jgi:thiol:disulfide interchange protein